MAQRKPKQIAAKNAGAVACVEDPMDWLKCQKDNRRIAASPVILSRRQRLGIKTRDGLKISRFGFRSCYACVAVFREKSKKATLASQLHGFTPF